MRLFKFPLCLFFVILLQNVSRNIFAQTKISLNSDQPAWVQWKLTPQSAVGADSLQMLQSDYNMSDWVPATVPGAVFTSYVNAGLEKDPNFGDNIYKVDKSKYDQNFWYRTLVATPHHKNGEKVRLNFKGINRKADVYFNNVKLGSLDGFMDHGDYDITRLLKPNGKNILAVLVYWPTLPVPNYASPTYISSDGWDWMPSVPGLLQGITDDVYFRITGAVKIIDPWIRTDVNTSLDKGFVSMNVALQNSADTAVKGIVKMLIQPGNIHVQQDIKLGAHADIHQTFDSSYFKQLVINNPKLWWPNGYGLPNLYSCHLSVELNGRISDTRDINFGIKKYSYDTIGNVLHIWINGKRIFVRGGNWGMSEYLLRCRGSEYDVKVKLHQQMHLNMIRNWIGSTTDDAFYDACDKYGIMVWDDFWLNSHPNLPRDIFSFNRNAVDKIKRFRNHPSIAVWCGDNEGYPLPPLNGWLREDVKTFDGGDRLYHPNSHADALTGSGPWTNGDPSWYFRKSPDGFGANKGWGFRSEIGTAVFTTFASFKKFMPKADWWPRNEMWNKHFFGKSADNAGPDHYFSTIEKSYGNAVGIEDFCTKAQLLNIETNKALYEGWQQHMWNDASGVMTWMSQSAYPSFVWQTYDYYYDLTGAYWGVKKAAEPIHIQWSYANDTVKVINTTLSALSDLKAEVLVYNLNGSLMPALGRTATISVAADTIASCFKINFSDANATKGLSTTHFIRLLLKDKEGNLLSDNFYWRSKEGNNYQELNSLPAAKLKVRSSYFVKDGHGEIDAHISNPAHAKAIAFAVHVQAIRTKDGERILPALMNDDYFTLMQGETKLIKITFDAALLKDGKYQLLVVPYNKK